MVINKIKYDIKQNTVGLLALLTAPFEPQTLPKFTISTKIKKAENRSQYRRQKQYTLITTPYRETSLCS